MERPVFRRSSRILITTIRENDKIKLHKLIELGAEVNTQDYSGNYPLHIATYERNADTVQLLLENGAVVDTLNSVHLRPYDIALQTLDYQTMKVLLDYNARVNVIDVRLFLDHFPKDLIHSFYRSIDMHESDPISALHLAVRYNDMDGVRFLLSKGADPNRQSILDGSSPLHFVKTAYCTRLLLRHGADPNSKNRYDCAPMYNVAISDQFRKTTRREEQGRIIEILFENGADGADVIYAGKIALDCGKYWDRMEGLRDVVKYIALKENMAEYSDLTESILRDETCELSHYYKRCLREIELLKKEKIYNEVTAHDFVKKNGKQLSKYVRRRHVYEKLKINQFKYEIQFTVYSEILQRHFEDALAYLKLRAKASYFITDIMKCINMGHIVTNKIINYLTEEDMENLIVAYQI